MGKIKVVPTRTRTELERLIVDFDQHLAAHGRSLRTREHYDDIVRRVLGGFLEREGLEPKDLTKRHLEALTGELLVAGRSRQTVTTYAVALNTFFKWCAGESELPEGLKAPKPSMPRKLIDVLTRAEIQRLEDAAETERDRLMVRVLADTGIRVGELRRLRLGDVVIDGRQRYLRVGGKTGERLVPLAPALAQRLERFAKRTRPEAASDVLFLTLVRGRSGDYEPLGESSIQHLLSLLGRKAGISKRVHPHGFRHAFATHLLRQNTNPLLVKQVLGHSSLAMLDRVYSHLVASDSYDATLKALSAE
jgi:integrase